MNLQDAFAESKKRSSPMSEHLAPMYHRATGGVGWLWAAWGYCSDFL